MNSQPNCHTHCQAAQANAQTKAWQRVCLSHPDKIELKKSFLPSENKKYATAQTNKTQTMTFKLNNDNSLQTRWTRTSAGNISNCCTTPFFQKIVFKNIYFDLFRSNFREVYFLTQITQLKFFEISLWGNPKFRRTIFCVFW